MENPDVEKLRKELEDARLELDELKDVKKKEDNRTSRCWTITLWKEHLDEDWLDRLKTCDKITYFIAGSEVCPQSKKEHWQGYVQFNVPERRSCLQKLFGKKHYFVRSRASDLDNYNYATKEGGEQIELGERKKNSGKRSDLEEAILAIKERRITSERKLYDEYPALAARYRNGFSGALSAYSARSYPPNYDISTFEWEPITDWSKSHILWGPPGIGKSEFALAHFKNALVVNTVEKLKSFDSTMHDAIIFDDMKFLHLPRESQIHLLDQTFDRDIHCRFSNATIPAHTKKIFTTNVVNGAIFSFYDEEEKEDVALTRRACVRELRPRSVTKTVTKTQ